MVSYILLSLLRFYFVFRGHSLLSNMTGGLEWSVVYSWLNEGRSGDRTMVQGINTYNKAEYSDKNYEINTDNYYN
jgi:hypothetical protein